MLSHIGFSHEIYDIIIVDYTGKIISGHCTRSKNQ